MSDFFTNEQKSPLFNQTAEETPSEQKKAKREKTAKPKKPVKKTKTKPGKESKNSFFSLTRKKTDSSETTEESGPYADILFSPSQPIINVLPNSVLERQKAGVLIRKFSFAGFAIVATLALGFLGNVALGVSNTSVLNSLAVEEQALQADLATLQPYQSYQTSLQTARQTLGQTLSTDVDVALLLSTLNTTANQFQIDYSNVQMQLNTGDSSACQVTDPFNPVSSIGCLTFTGTSGSQDNVTNFIDQLNATSGFAGAFPSTIGTTTGEGGVEVSFQGTVTFDSVYYSLKYNNLTTPLTTTEEVNATGDASTDQQGTTSE